MSVPEKPDISEVFADNERVGRALARGVRDALAMHKALGNPVVECRDGEIIWVQPEDISISEVDE